MSARRLLVARRPNLVSACTQDGGPSYLGGRGLIAGEPPAAALWQRAPFEERFMDILPVSG